MSVNCDNSDGAKQRALENVQRLVDSEASKGLIDASLVDSIVEWLRDLAAVALATDSTNIRELNSFLEKSLSAAKVFAAAKASSTTNATTPGTQSRQGLAIPASLSSLLPSLNSTVVQGRGPRKTTTSGASQSDGSAASSSTSTSKSSTVASTASPMSITAGELADYFQGIVPTDNDDFALRLWLRHGENPLFLQREIGYAKTLHETVVKPIARYYKRQIYNNPDYPIRLATILYGIATEKEVRGELLGGASSRHLLGQAVNFTITSVDDLRVVQDIRDGKIQVPVGTYGRTSAIHATLPFRVNGVDVENLYIWQDSGIPGFAGYTLPT